MTRALVLLLALAACAPQEYDHGGRPDLALASVRVADSRSEQVIIRGRCYSACALKLAARNVCVSPSARIGVHEVRRSLTGDYELGTRDGVLTAFYAETLPACARKLFAAQGGFDSGRIVAFSGGAILLACPEIQPCG